jgi:hypothetical protein
MPYDEILNKRRENRNNSGSYDRRDNDSSAMRGREDKTMREGRSEPMYNREDTRKEKDPREHYQDYLNLAKRYSDEIGQNEHFMKFSKMSPEDHEDLVDEFKIDRDMFEAGREVRETAMTPDAGRDNKWAQSNKREDIGRDRESLGQASRKDDRMHNYEGRRENAERGEEREGLAPPPSYNNYKGATPPNNIDQRQEESRLERKPKKDPRIAAAMMGEER